MELNTLKMSLYCSESDSSFSKDSSDKEFSLPVSIVALVHVFILLTAENSLSTVHEVMGRVRSARSSPFILGKISLGHASSTSKSDEKCSFFSHQRWLVPFF